MPIEAPRCIKMLALAGKVDMLPGSKFDWLEKLDKARMRYRITEDLFSVEYFAHLFFD